MSKDFVSTCLFSNKSVWECGPKDLFCKTHEMFYLWYIYFRAFNPNAHLLIIDQKSSFDLGEFLSFCGEDYEFIEDFNYSESKTIHIHKFDDACDKATGVKRGYFYLYNFFYKNNLDFNFIETDCLLADSITDKVKQYDFITNYINKKEGVCDTYLNSISANHLRSLDGFIKFDDFLVKLKGLDEKQELINVDVVLRALIERGIYSLFCFGDIYEYRSQNVIHYPENYILLEFLKLNPISASKHSERLTQIIEEMESHHNEYLSK